MLDLQMGGLVGPLALSGDSRGWWLLLGCADWVLPDSLPAVEMRVSRCWKSMLLTAVAKSLMAVLEVGAGEGGASSAMVVAEVAIPIEFNADICFASSTSCASKSARAVARC